MEIFSVRDLSFSYPDTNMKSVDGIRFTVEKGDFITLCGPTGSGKSTLLRLMKNELSPVGTKTGEILFNGKRTEELSIAESASVGFVLQSPELQTVTDKVWHEIAFGLENLQLSTEVIRRRVAEIMCYFGIEDLFDKNTSDLSGGQKQLVALAAVMAMHPEVILLDEPTSQLDPIAAADFLAALSKINEEQGMTILLAEHRLENAVPICSKLAVMDKGRLIGFGSPRDVCAELLPDENISAMLPAAARIYSMTGQNGLCPLSVKEGKKYVEKYFACVRYRAPEKKYLHSEKAALTVKDLRFRYAKDLPDVLNGTDLTVYENEFLCILGGNGSGKSTFLNVCAGLLNAYYGKTEIFGKKLKDYKGQSLYNNCVAMLPQDVQTVFLRNSLREEFEEVGVGFDILPVDLSYAAETHPYDLSGGEQQLAALAKVLAAKPRLLLLDEPTKGLDAISKKKIGDVLIRLKQSGMTILAVTHDVDFAAMCADRCAMFFRGAVTSIDTPENFFSMNTFYTTSVNRIMRDTGEKIITAQEAADVLNGFSVGTSQHKRSGGSTNGYH